MQILDQAGEKDKQIIDEQIVCSQCGKKPAEIFQVTGDFCLDCWQIVTHTNT